jgi:hypothetical protein
MPEVSQFMSGFGFTYGVTYHGYTLVRIDGTHQNTGSHHYVYDFTLTFDSSKAQIHPQEFFNMFVFNNDLVINSSYGTPYSCHLEKDHFIVNGTTMTIYLSGRSHRV